MRSAVKEKRFGGSPAVGAEANPLKQAVKKSKEIEREAKSKEIVEEVMDYRTFRCASAKPSAKT